MQLPLPVLQSLFEQLLHVLDELFAHWELLLLHFLDEFLDHFYRLTHFFQRKALQSQVYVLKNVIQCVDEQDHFLLVVLLGHLDALDSTRQTVLYLEFAEQIELRYFQVHFRLNSPVTQERDRGSEQTQNFQKSFGLEVSDLREVAQYLVEGELSLGLLAHIVLEDSRHSRETGVNHLFIGGIVQLVQLQGEVEVNLKA